MVGNNVKTIRRYCQVITTFFCYWYSHRQPLVAVHLSPGLTAGGRDGSLAIALAIASKKPIFNVLCLNVTLLMLRWKDFTLANKVTTIIKIKRGVDAAILGES